MNDQSPYPDDEPVIGLDTPPRPSPRLANPFARRRAPLPPIDADDYDGGDDFDDGDEIFIGEGADEVYREYYDASPARQPIFYVLLTLAALIGATAIFFIVRSFSDSGNTEGPGQARPVVYQVAIASPVDGDRVNAGETISFVARASASGVVTRFELIIDDKLATQAAALEQPGVDVDPATQARVYGATLQAKFDRRGDHRVSVRAVLGDAVRESTTIRLVVVEAPRDVQVLGRVIASTSLRTGPGETFPEVGTLRAGNEVRLVARTSNGEWFLIDDAAQGERWVRANAIQVDGDAESLPQRDTASTPTPGTTSTIIATATPARATTPTPASGPPDFVPTDARFVFSGAGRIALRITIRNDGGSYSGPLVIALTTTSPGLVAGQLVFDVTLGNNRSTTVDFDVIVAPQGKVDVTARIDPSNAVRESNDDNNSATFRGISAPVEPPNIDAGVTVQPGPAGSIIVTVRNSGGPLAATEFRVRLRVGGQEQTSSKTVALGTGESTTFTFAKFASGDGILEVSAGGVPVASGTFTVGGSATASATAPTSSTTPTSPATTGATATAIATRTP